MRRCKKCLSGGRYWFENVNGHIDQVLDSMYESCNCIEAKKKKVKLSVRERNLMKAAFKCGVMYHNEHAKDMQKLREAFSQIKEVFSEEW